MKRSVYTNRSRYLNRFTLVLIISIVVTAAGALILSSYLNNSTYTTVLSGELKGAHTQGKGLAESYARGEISAEDCRERFNNVLYSSRCFWIIYDTETVPGENGGPQSTEAVPDGKETADTEPVFTPAPVTEYRLAACSEEALDMALYLTDLEQGRSQMESILAVNGEAAEAAAEKAAREAETRAREEEARAARLQEEAGNAAEPLPEAVQPAEETARNKEDIFIPEISFIDIPDELSSEMADVAIIAERLGDVVLVTGLPHAIYEVPFGDTRVRLLIYIPLLVLIMLLISTFFTRGVARPARQLIDAADEIKQGKRPVLPENLYGEAGEIATAFNYLTKAVNETLAALQYEKETLGLVIEGLHEGIIATDEENRLIENTAARELLGGEETDARKTVEKAMREEVSSVISGKIGTGTRQVLLYTVSPLPKREGKSAGKVALIRDITEQELLENTRHDYVANISHELRTPLSSIRGLGEGLRDGLVSNEADRERYYSIIVDEANRLSRLVNDLLELSGLQSNPASFETEKVDLNELLYDLYDLNGRIFAEKGITFTLSVPEEPLPTVISNEDRLSQVLTILLDNARKYTQPGGTVTLGGERAENSIRVYVKDTGIGMDEETRKMAFERFHQAEKSRSDKGNGLGLAIAKEIMQKLGLVILLESAPGRGSEFSFDIPLTNAEKAEK